MTSHRFFYGVSDGGAVGSSMSGLESVVSTGASEGVVASTTGFFELSGLLSFRPRLSRKWFQPFLYAFRTPQRKSFTAQTTIRICSGAGRYRVTNSHCQLCCPRPNVDSGTRSRAVYHGGATNDSQSVPVDWLARHSAGRRHAE